MARVTYEMTDGVARIRLNDGKVNAMGPDMQREIGEAFAQAREQRAIVLLAGKPGVFSAGFDLKVLQGDSPGATLDMVRGGFELAEQVLTYPHPVVALCEGHAIAMGLFLLLSASVIIGADGEYRLSANEVAIGLTAPLPALAILRHRLTPRAFERAATLAEPFSADNAVAAGLLDRVVPAANASDVALQLARSLKTLDQGAHTETKRRCREPLLKELRVGIEADFGPQGAFRQALLGSASGAE